MTVKKIAVFLHLWLGLASGLIVFIVSITGCIYVFEREIRDFTENWRFVKPLNQPFLRPSQLTAIAEKRVPGEKAATLTYSQRNEAAIVGFFERGPDRKKTVDKATVAKKGEVAKKAGVSEKPKGGGKFTAVYLNPYTAEILDVKTIRRGTSEGVDFFRFILNGHRALWLPYNIGRPIVGVSVLIFVIILITGLVLWWPKKWSQATRDKSFKIKWGASFKRVNYDLHNVFGFYSMLVLLIIATTGLVWSFEWVSKGIYWATTGGRSLTERDRMVSDTTRLAQATPTPVDQVWLTLTRKEPQHQAMFISLPKKPADVITAMVYLRPGTFYKTDVYAFDQFTLRPLKSDGPFSGRYADADAADKLRRMNYDIHIGAVLGLPGKILAFLASLISASLPITGFLVWWGKRKKAPKASRKNRAVAGRGPEPVRPRPQRLNQPSSL